MIRALAVAGGICVAGASSQFPEYSQQYMQRLSGAVDELSAVVAQFDADAQGLGLSRAQALDDLAQGGRMGEARALSMGRVLSRYDRLSRDLAVLKDSTALDRALNAWRLSERDLARATWADFRPALPVSVEGAGFAGAGFGLGYVLFAGLLAGVGRLVRRRPAPTPAE